MSAPTIGALDCKLVLEQPQDAPDYIGGVVRSWVAVDTVWAHVAPLRAAQRFAGERMESAASHRIAIRWRPDLTAAMRLRNGARVFAIHAATDGDGRRRFIICHCEELA